MGPDIYALTGDYTQGGSISTLQTDMNKHGPLILGGTGQVGRMLARVWPQGPAPLWQRRAGATPVGDDDLVWDILSQDSPAVPRPVGAVVVLAGAIHGPDLSVNTSLAQAGCALAARLGVRALVASSQAVYGRQSGLVSETDTAHPANAYGQAKYDMEHAVAGLPDVTCLRIGNVAGADGLFGAMGRGPIRLDRFSDGRAPQRMMIGPRDLARVLTSLCCAPAPLPPLLNIAAPGLIGMDALAQAAGVTWDWQPAPDTALPELAMDVGALTDLVPLAPATASDLVAQARAGGWKVAS